MNAVTLSDLQSMLNASEGRMIAALTAATKRVDDLDEKWTPMVADVARHGVRLDHVEQTVSQLEADAPTNNAVSRVIKYAAVTIFAALVGSMSNFAKDTLASVRHPEPKPQPNEQPK